MEGILFLGLVGTFITYLLLYMVIKSGVYNGTLKALVAFKEKKNEENIVK